MADRARSKHCYNEARSICYLTTMRIFISLVVLAGWSAALPPLIPAPCGFKQAATDALRGKILKAGVLSWAPFSYKDSTDGKWRGHDIVALIFQFLKLVRWEHPDEWGHGKAMSHPEKFGEWSQSATKRILTYKYTLHKELSKK